jgi:hypothetical protein
MHIICHPYILSKSICQDYSKLSIGDLIRCSNTSKHQ